VFNYINIHRTLTVMLQPILNGLKSLFIKIKCIETKFRCFNKSVMN